MYESDILPPSPQPCYKLVIALPLDIIL